MAPPDIHEVELTMKATVVRYQAVAMGAAIVGGYR